MKCVSYKCDICGKDNSESNLITVKLPIAQIGYKRVDSYTLQSEYRFNQTRELEICEECAGKVVKGYREYLGVGINGDGIVPLRGE